MADARALYKEAFSHFVGDRFDEAIAKYRESLEADETLAIAWNGLAMALAQKGDLDAAIAAAKKLIELEPDEPLSHTSLSMFYQRKGLIPEAEDEKAIAMQLQMKNRGT